MSAEIIKKGNWIYWRWKDEKTFLKSFVQEIVGVGDDVMLELADTDMWTKYPNRVLSKEIEAIKISNP